MEQLLERFCRYVKVETTANEKSETYPSSPGQKTLAAMLADELRALGAADVSVDENSLVWATVPGTVRSAPTICWLAHVDTSPEVSGANVKPIVHRNYDGRDIPLPGDPSRVIRVSETPHLKTLTGKTIITTDGTTLLGADDKAGVAVIMTTVARLMADKTLPRGPIRILFTCDEEIGRGCDKVDIERIGAVCAYTLDGEAQGLIEAETFSANLAVVTFHGRNAHPGYAYGKMINAIRLAAEFVERMPRTALAPEATRGRQGFLHPYVIEGGVEKTVLRIILRSFETPELETHARTLQAVADSITAEFPAAKVEIDIREQYRNMAEYLSKEPRAVTLAAEAFRAIGIEPEHQIIRGGTDGSRLSQMGLPTPNLSAGMHNYHSPYEFACLEEMQTASDMLIELARRWSEASGTRPPANK